MAANQGGHPVAPRREAPVLAVKLLGVADQLDDTPRTGAELAAAVGAHAEALSRVLRLLAAYGVFESLDGKFSHSAASRMLRTDHPQSMRDYARMFGLPPFWAAFGELEQSVRTGQQVGDKVTAGGLWAYLGQDPEANTIFNATMAAKAHANIAGIITAYDFSGFTKALSTRACDSAASCSRS